MTVRRLSVPIEINASQTRCDECHFQHSEADVCVLFGSIEVWRENGQWGHKRHKDCAIAEWKANKGIVE